MLHLPLVPREILERMWLILLLRAGDVRPHPGPARRRLPPRPLLPVTRGRAVRAVTRAHRSLRVAEFEAWGRKYSLFQSLSALVVGPLEDLDQHRENYG